MDEESKYPRLAQVKNVLVDKSFMGEPLMEVQRKQQVVNKDNRHCQGAKDI
jgi:hypothetical protein